MQKALLKELRDLEAKPDEGITVVVNEDNIAEVTAEMEGPGTRSMRLFPRPNLAATTQHQPRMRVGFSNSSSPVEATFQNHLPKVGPCCLYVKRIAHDFPSGMFITKIFHPNIARTGEICVNVLKRDWKADMGLRHVLLVIRCLLIQPFPDSALNEEAGRLIMEDYEEFCKHARLMTSIHALPAKRYDSGCCWVSWCCTVLSTAQADAAHGGRGG